MKPFYMKDLKTNNPHSKPTKKQYHALRREMPAFPVILAHTMRESQNITNSQTKKGLTIFDESFLKSGSSGRG